MLLKLLLCLSFLLAVTSEEVNHNAEIEDAANAILKKFSETHRDKLKSIASSIAKDPRAQVAVINDYVDDLLKELNNFIIIHGYDPIRMPDIEEGFEWKVGFIKYKGLMHLTSGWLQGMGTMRRFGDVKVTYTYPNVQIRAPMGYNVLMFDYKYKAKFMGLGPSGRLDGKTTNPKFTINLDINMITLMAKLNRFRMDTVGKVSLKFGGNALTDWMTNIFVSVTIPFVKPILNIVIEIFVSGGISSAIAIYNDFMCNLLGHCLQ